MPESDSPQPESEARGWLDRLIELGNHNKIIAIATLLTIATGLPYLVGTALGAFSGEGQDDVVTREVLQEVIGTSLAKARAEARESAGPLGTQLNVLHSDMGSQELVPAALAPTATPEEMNAVYRAFERHLRGESSAALTDFEQIASAQEARGALEDAAATWRQRASLIQFTDTAEAVANLERAESLNPGSATELLNLSSLQSAIGRGDDSCQTLRRAIRAARIESNDRLLAIGLVRLGKFAGVTWWKEASWEEEQANAKKESFLVLKRHLKAVPGDVALIPAYANGLVVTGFARIDAGEPAQTLFAEFAEETARVRALENVNGPEIGRDVALMSLLSEHAFLLSRTADSETAYEQALPLFQECLVQVENVMASANCELPHLRAARPVVDGAYWFARHGEDWDFALRTSELDLELATRLAALYSGNAVASYVMSTAHGRFAHSYIQSGEVENAIHHYRLGFAAHEDGIPFQEQAGPAYSELANAYWVAGLSLPLSHSDLGDEWIRKAREVLVEKITEPQFADYVAGFVADIDEALAERSTTP